MFRQNRCQYWCVSMNYIPNMTRPPIYNHHWYNCWHKYR